MIKLENILEKIRAYLISKLLSDDEKYLLYYAIKDSQEAKLKMYVNSRYNLPPDKEDVNSLNEMITKWNLIEPI